MNTKNATNAGTGLLAPLAPGELGAVEGGDTFPALSRDFLLGLIRPELAQLDALTRNPVPFPVPLP